MAPLSAGQQVKTSQTSGIDPKQVTKVKKEAEQKIINSHYNPRASMPLEVDGGGIKSGAAFSQMAKSK
jgi:hypothetical protein